MNAWVRRVTFTTHHTSIPAPETSIVRFWCVQQHNDALPQLRIPSLESVVQEPPLALQLSERALDDYPGFKPVRVEALSVSILRIMKAHYQLGP